MREHRPGHFSVEIPNARKHLWSLAIMLMVIGAGFIFVGFKFLGDRSPQPGGTGPAAMDTIASVFNLMGSGFQGLWILMAALMAGGGLFLSIYLFNGRQHVKKLEGNDFEIAIRTYRHGRVWKEQSFPRAEVADIRAFTSGSSNGRTMKRLELVMGNKAETIARWIEGDAADTLVTEVRAVL